MIISYGDFICCSSLIGLTLFTILIARVVQLLLHAWSLRGYRKAIEMNGARCLLSETGELGRMVSGAIGVPFKNAG